MPFNTTLYGIGGTDTFRLNSKAILKLWGTNLQNIEKYLRRMYIPKKGYKFVQVDQSGAEALIVAYLCRAGKFRQLFDNNIKPHSFVALNLFDYIWQEELKSFGGEHKLDIKEFTTLDIPSIPTHSRWRELDKLIRSSDNWPPQRRYYYISKQVCHSANYGIKPPTFQLNVLEKSRGKIVLTLKQAQDYLAFYHDLFPEIREWHREVEEQVRETRILYNLFGFPREFTGDINERSLKAAYAFPAQSTVGTITNVAYTNMQRYIESTKRDFTLLANTHDSYMCMAPETEDIECANKMQEYINQEFTYRGATFKMKSEAVSGYNWAPYDEKKNPLGLRDI